MKKLITLFVVLFISITSAFSQEQWKTTGHKISDVNGNWTIEITYSSITIKDHKQKKINPSKSYIKVNTTDDRYSATYYDVDIKHPDCDRRVKAVCEFFMQKEGVILIKFDNKQISFPTYKKLIKDELSGK